MARVDTILVNFALEIHMNDMCIYCLNPPFSLKCRISEKTEYTFVVGSVIDAVEDYRAQQTERDSNVSPSEGETEAAETKFLTPKKRQSAKSGVFSSGATTDAIYPLNTSIFFSIVFFFF